MVSLQVVDLGLQVVCKQVEEQELEYKQEVLDNSIHLDMNKPVR
jgi:hypothetical protein